MLATTRSAWKHTFGAIFSSKRRSGAYYCDLARPAETPAGELRIRTVNRDRVVGESHVGGTRRRPVEAYVLVSDRPSNEPPMAERRKRTGREPERSSNQDSRPAASVRRSSVPASS